MRRAWVAAAILLAAIIVSIAGVCRTNSIANDMERELSELQGLSIEQAGEKLSAIQKQWDKDSKILSCYTRHNEVEEVTVCMGRLESMLKREQKELFYLECTNAINAITHLRETEQPHIYNVL